MDCSRSLCALIILLFLCLQSTADLTGSVLFLDSPNRQYFRPPLSDPITEGNSLLLSEVGAAVSVLLGFAPPATLSATGSSKLNEILMPNPFNRPRAVFLLDVRGAEDSRVMMQSDNTLLGSAHRSGVISGPSKADVLLTDEDEVSVISLNEPLSSDTDVEFTDNELSDFASWLGGTYVANALEPVTGELTIPLPSGADINLHLSKKADREFIGSLVFLVHNTRKAVDVHQDLSESKKNPAELITGNFDGIKALRETYGTEGIAEQGLELFFISMSKIFDSLQTLYKGQIVGVILFNGSPLPESETVLNLVYSSHPSARSLKETKDSSTSANDPEVVLVRRTLAWLTGIILIIATLLGIHFLLNMPLTKDTLLYSNVKLD
ncbi:uncharacterized protein LOC127799918 [Diospyros lotus]|uniref:uncharacterized protein LOC127799918 n=1 Tax=Diospyros lotus TaxID=55363 RepID=UPI0022516D2F|nr:uncharacterized protein LOC127799918 [Diospyros lotus]XP_052190166.1 uncharacterized protein LOC127799918 [Diospyros lotus]